MKNYKYANLILAYTDPIQLKRLVYVLDYEYFDIFIHLDNKKKIEEFGFDEYNLQKSKMYIIDKRENVYWGDISIVNATLTMYKKAFSVGKYKRYITLSGLDYPILSNKEIYDMFSDSSVEYIMGNPIRGKEFHKVECRYYLKRTVVNKILNKIVCLVYDKANITFGKRELLLTSGENGEFILLRNGMQCQVIL